MSISKTKILKATILPGIIPRLKNLLGSGFGNFAYLIALVYNTVRILPHDHAYLKPKNIGSFSIRQVIAEAANHINPSRKNIDQVIIFFTIIAAIIIFIFQILILIFSLAITQANAAMPNTIAGFFVTPNPREDIAYRLLDLVFGVPGVFDSKSLTTNNLHSALQSLFEFYSYGMLIVGAMIIIYFVVAVVAETAQSGVPFGQRFNKAWVPVRLTLFFALLIPVSHGMNGGQYLTLNIAKMGSALASTGWVIYNDSITETLTGRAEQNIAKPTGPIMTHLPAFMLIARTCERAYMKGLYKPNGFPDSWNPNNANTGIRAWVVYQQKAAAGGGYNAVKMEGTTFQNIAGISQANNFTVVFGVRDATAYPEENGNVFPVCGSLVFHITDISQPGSEKIHTAYYDMIKNMWEGTGDPIMGELNQFATNYVNRLLSAEPARDPSAELPDQAYKEEWLEYLKEHMNGDPGGVVATAVRAQIIQGDWEFTTKMKDFGWAGAHTWYNKFAEQNGAIVSALYQMPTPKLYPNIMERVYERNKRENTNLSEKDKFSPDAVENAAPLTENIPGELQVLTVLVPAYQYWEGSDNQVDLFLTGNPLIDTINVVLGTDGLFRMCANIDVHPLAQLSSAGKSMVDNAIRSFVMAGAFSIASIIPNPFSGAAEAMAGFFGTVASVGLLIGFILFYVLPFMPFLYFFFAIGSWIKTIFEAMVAVPLWALAHLRIDGDGIAGEAAMNGYFLLFEIFIRPILIIFGLLAAITIFAALVRVLNDIFYLALANISGHGSEGTTTCFIDPSKGADDLTSAKMGPIDEFFYTVVYTIIVYILGTGCFKLIDMIPDNMLRWISAGVSSLGDTEGDAAEGLIKYISIGGSQFGQQLGAGIGGVGKGLKGSVGEAAQYLK